MIAGFKNKLRNDRGLRELVSAGFVSFFMQCSGLLLGYILMALIANYFGARALGIYSFSYTVLTLAIILAVFGLDVVILKIAGQNESHSSTEILKKIYSIIIPSALLLTCALVAVVLLYSKSLFNEVEYNKYLIVSALSILFSVVLTINIEYLRAKRKIAISEFLRNVIRPLMSLCLMIVICFYYYDIYVPVYALLISAFLACIISIYFVLFYDSNKYISNSSVSETAGALIQSGLPMQASTLLFYLISNMVIFFVKGYEDSAAVGLMLVSIKLAAIINMPLMVLNKVCAPRFSQLYCFNEYDELQKYITQVTKLAFFFSTLAAIFLIIFSETVLSVFGDDFVHAKKLLFILIFGQIVSCASGSVGIFMMMTGNEKAYKNIVAIVALLAFFFYCVALPRYGVVGAACVLAGSQVALNLTSVIYIKYRMGFITMYIPFLKYLAFSKP